jgi:hypothetical protein
MAPTVIVALIAATGTLAKAAVDAYQETKVAKWNSKAQIVVASLAVISAAITATPKAIEVYRLTRKPQV